MTRQQQRDWAKKKVHDLTLKYAAQTKLFSDAFAEGDTDDAEFWIKRRQETLDKIMAFIE